MTLEVYWGSGSPPAWRVLLTLEAKKIPYVSRLLQFAKEEHKAPGFLALNPRGKVPTIKDGDYVLAESIAIMAYLDRKYPDPPLFGRSAEETGRVWKAISDLVYYLEPAGLRIVVPVLFGTVEDNTDDIRAAVPEAHDELGIMERRLSDNDWLALDRLSAADLAVYPSIEILLRAAGKDSAQPLGLGLLPFAERYPAIEKWRERIRALPGYDKTYPPHWR
ncbi:MAG: glutathione S-transferase family protein [Rhodospirillales bacterium]|nr:glutathione S-transferase family protein [Rhodospirillales bacterium]